MVTKQSDTEIRLTPNEQLKCRAYPLLAEGEHSFLQSVATLPAKLVPGLTAPTQHCVRRRVMTTPRIT